MKKFIIKLFAFFLFGFIAYTSLIFLWGSVFHSRMNKNMNFKIGSNGHLYSRLGEINKYKNIDILFIGSSHAYRGFDPRIFRKHGIKTFNLGSSSQTPLQTKILLERYLNKLNPKLIVYEVYPATFEIDGVESGIDLISNANISFDFLGMAYKLNHIKVYNTLLFSFINQMLGLRSGFSEKLNKGKDLYIPGGYVERMDTLISDNKMTKSKFWNLDPNSLAEFEDIMKMIKLKSQKYILVQTPVTQNLFDSYKNNTQTDNYFMKKGAFINFNEILDLDNNNFYDDNHLNKNGVAVFNEFFISKLRELKLI